MSIAYLATGNGPPIVQVSMVDGSDLRFMPQMMGGRYGSLEPLTQRHTVVRYDGRGSGLSQRESPDFSLDARVLDLVAVVDHLRLESLAPLFEHAIGEQLDELLLAHPEDLRKHLLVVSAERGSGRRDARRRRRDRMRLFSIGMGALSTLSVASRAFRWARNRGAPCSLSPYVAP